MAEKDVKGLLEKFKTELKEFFSTEKFLDFKLADGTIVRCDSNQLQKGSRLNVIDEKGQVLPMPDGEYVDPQTQAKFTVEAGYVKDVVAPAAMADPASQANPPANNSAPDMGAMMDMINKINSRLDAIEQAIAADAQADQGAAMMKSQEALKKELSEQKEAFKKLFSLVEEIASSTEEPTAKPANRTSNPQTDEEKIKKFRKEHFNL